MGHTRYHRHQPPLSLASGQGWHAPPGRRKVPNRFAVIDSTGDPPPNRGVQHQPVHPFPAGYGPVWLCAAWEGELEDAFSVLVPVGEVAAHELG